MDAWAAFLAALLDMGLRLLEKVDAARADDFRRRVAADGAGVLLGQLNPEGSNAASAKQSATSDVERSAGRMDGQQ